MEKQIIGIAHSSLGNGMGFQNPCGLQVWVWVEILLFASFKTSLCSSKTLVLKGIPVGSWVKSTMGMGTGKMPDTHRFTNAIPYSLPTHCTMITH